MRERDLIARIQSQFSDKSNFLLKGIGDDCAVFADSENSCWLISTDLLVEDVHFVTDWHEPYILGRKSIAVNLSDIAAMGGQPHFILHSLVLPSHLSDQWLDRWHAGAQSMLDEFSCVLIGGDVSKGEQFAVNVVAIGSAHPKSVVYRSGASAGQDVYVTGYLGSSAAGLELLKKGHGPNSEYKDLIDAHLDPQPQVEIGLKLAEKGLASAMQDISDGIATDLSHLCRESNISAVVEAEKIPVDKLLIKQSFKTGLSALDFALYGGEDYQLIFTSTPENGEALQDLAKSTDTLITKIGKTHKGPTKVLLSEAGQMEDISYKGYEHI